MAKRSGHIALIVEDNDANAEALAKNLLNLKCESVRFDNASDAIAWIDAGNRFCIAFFDSQLPENLGGHPEVSIGRMLLKNARDLVPGMTVRRKYLLQIVVVSGAAKDELAQRQAIQCGASDFLPKPFTAGQVFEVFDRCMKESERPDHGVCETLHEAIQTPPVAARTAKSVRLVIKKQVVGRHGTVMVDGETAKLPLRSFVVLLLLAEQKRLDPAASVNKKEHGLDAHETWKPAAKLVELLPSVAGTDGMGRFFLKDAVDATGIDWPGLAKNDDAAIEKVALRVAGPKSV